MPRKIPMEITAAGIDADTVIPAYSPRYVFAAPIMIDRIIPSIIARSVSSLTIPLVLLPQTDIFLF